MFSALFRRRAGPNIDRLYGVIMAAALSRPLYARFAVPDTFEGRFESACLHMALVLQRLQALPPPAGEAAQALVNRFFDGLDSAIREHGIGDVAVPKRMKRFMQAFYGRANAYAAAFAPDAPEAGLAQALGRNLLDGAAPTPDLVAWIRSLAGQLERAELATLLAQPQTYFAACDGKGKP